MLHMLLTNDFDEKSILKEQCKSYLKNYSDHAIKRDKH